MKLLMVASAKGGAGKTSAAVRIAETMTRRGIPAGVVDLSPSPTSHLLIRDKAIFMAPGRGATTLTAAGALLKPYEEKYQLAVIDTGGLDDVALDPWIPLTHAVLLVMRIDAQSIAALPTVYRGTDRIKRLNAGMKFPGVLPMMVVPDAAQLLATVRRRIPGWFFAEEIPHSAAEAALHQACCVGTDSETAQLGASPLQKEWDLVAARLATVLELQPVAAPVQQPRFSTKGMLGRLWQKAADALGSRVRVV